MGCDDVSADAVGGFTLSFTVGFSVRHCVQSQRGGVLLGPQTQVFNARGLAVVAGESAGCRRLKQRAVPHLLGMMG